MGDGNFFGKSFGIDDEWNESEDDHGIHITGVIMARANNSIGVRGILSDAKSSNFCLMVARVFGSVRSTSTSIIDEAVEWCVDNGAKVINLSLGTSYRSRSSEVLVDRIVKEEDVILVAAAGNAPDLRSLHSFFYPASFPGVISVASVDSDLNVSSFSQRNSEVDVSAPGRDVLSLAAKPEIMLFDESDDLIESKLMMNSMRPGAPITAKVWDCDYGLEPCTNARGRICIMSRGENTFSEKVRNCYIGGGVAMVLYNNEPGSIAGSLGPDPPNIPALCVNQNEADRLLDASELTIKQGIGSYATLSGTSMATPHVTGAIAKIWAARPNCSKDQVRAAILETAIDLGEPGPDEDYGVGLVQVVKAYDYLMTLPSPCGEGEPSSNDASANNGGGGGKDEDVTASQIREESHYRFPTARPIAIAPAPRGSSSEGSVWDRLRERLRGSG
jgi:subtilisin family serine protease